MSDKKYTRLLEAMAAAVTIDAHCTIEDFLAGYAGSDWQRVKNEAERRKEQRRVNQ
jgi:Mn-dependent DtxR family transcriptional regulator